MRKINRREAVAGGAGVLAALAGSATGMRGQERRGRTMVVCFIRYQIDPYQRDEFQKYAEKWGKIIPRCGGHLIGYFLPHEGTNDVGWGLVGFESLAAYEAYRARLRTDAEARENFAFAQTKRFILREERTFPQVVEGTFEMRRQEVGGRR